MIIRAMWILLLLVSMVRGKIQVHGHRGARARMPENSLAAFEYAIKVGVDVLEMDVVVTKDDELVVHNTAFVSDLCDAPAALSLSRAIRSLTFQQVQQYECNRRNPLFSMQQVIPGTKIPSLDQVFELVMKFSLLSFVSGNVRQNAKKFLYCRQND